MEKILPKAKAKYGPQYQILTTCPYCNSIHIHKWEGLNDNNVRQASCGKGQYALEFNAIVKKR